MSEKSQEEGEFYHSGDEKQSEGFGEEDPGDGFQYDDKGVAQGAFGQAANALGGLGDAMGLEEEGAVDELTAMEMEIAGANPDGEPVQDSKVKIRVFINFDEDDKNDHGIDLNELFQRRDETKPYFIDVSKDLYT